jgi:hypothetical protein
MARSGLHFRVKNLEARTSLISSLVSENQRDRIYNFLEHYLKDKNNRVSNPVRMGSANDGGYVLNRITDENFLLSIGIGQNAEFERECGKYLNYGVAYDGTIASLPAEFPKKFSWIATNVHGTSQQLSNFATINEVFENCRSLMGHSLPKILFKIDVEGSEYSIFESVDEENMLLCSQIVMELHNFATNLLSDIDLLIKLFDKLNLTHSLVLFHANNYDFDLRIGAWCVPNAIELTWVHRDSFNHSRLDYPMDVIESLLTPNNRFVKDYSVDNSAQ